MKYLPIVTAFLVSTIVAGSANAAITVIGTGLGANCFQMA